MYSFEIRKYLKDRDFRITPLEFMAIINSSPQIKYVGYDERSSIYTITSDDGLSIGVEILEEPKKMTLKKDSN